MLAINIIKTYFYIGDVAYRRIDVSFNSQFIKIYGYSKKSTVLMIEFTEPIDFDRVCIVVPAAEAIPRWLRTFHYFQPTIWASLLITLIIVSFIWLLLRVYHPLAPGYYSQCDRNYCAVILDTFMVFVGEPLSLSNILPVRILIGALLLFGVTIMGAFTGTLYHSFTNEMYYRSINTLEELDKTGLSVATASTNLRDIFGIKDVPDDSPIFPRLRQKLNIYEDTSMPIIQRTANEKNIAAITRETLFTIHQYRYVDNNGRSLLHLIPECPQTYYLAYVMPANSIFIEPFNSLIISFKEAGLILFWNENTKHESIRHEMNVNGEVGNLKEPAAFTIKDMQTCFLILLFGLAGSFITFIIERIL